MNRLLFTGLLLSVLCFPISLLAQDCETDQSPLHALGGEDEITNIDVQAVYYLAQDSEPLPDWRERVEYHLKRSQKFHARELGGQSQMHYTLAAEPFVSSATLAGLPKDDPNNFFWHIVNEVMDSGRIHFREGMFPILLVFSDMNFSPGYSDWTRECSGEGCVFEAPHSDCKGWVNANGEDRPGSRCGGARAVYWAERHTGEGLVTADGWRVPIKGTDCVTYHEGIGHSIGLPHPEPINDSVMGLAQYVDTIQKAWVDEDQKLGLGWKKEEVEKTSLFSTFSVKHEPTDPSAADAVTVSASLPYAVPVKSIVLECQDDLRQPFRPLPAAKTTGDTLQVTVEWRLPPMETGKSRAYRVRVETRDGQTEEIWNFYKVRR